MPHHRTKRPQPPLPPTGHCEACDKFIYYTRAAAKKAAQRQGARQRVYPCPENDEHWHRASWQPAGRAAFYRERRAGGPERLPEYEPGDDT